VRTSRTGRVALVAVAAVVVGAVAIVAVRAQSHTHTHTHPRVRASATATATADVCSDFASRAVCSQVTVASRAYRYTLHRAAQATRDTVIVDFGGPGVPVLADDNLSAFTAEVPEVFERYNVLAFDEPWSTATVDTPCRQALATFMAALSATPAGTATRQAATVRSTCHVQDGGRWGFTPSAYRMVVEAARTKENLAYSGFIGQSFGSARLAYLESGSARMPFTWAVLSRPYPVGADGSTLLARRAAAADALMVRGKHAKATVQAPTSGATTVSPFDKLSAEAELGYLATDAQAQAAADITAGNPDVIQRLSDQLWQRYGDDNVSPAYLAQLDELCSTAKVKALTAYRSPADILAARLLPCDPAAAGTMPRLTLGSIPLCVAAADADTVAPASLVRTELAKASTTATWVNLTDASHTGSNGIGQREPALRHRRGKQRVRAVGP
jgi:hypothetical protein